MSRHHGRVRRGAPWSKLKSRIEALFVPDLPIHIHCNVYTKQGNHDLYTEPRHWITLGTAVIWDFPGPAMRDPPFRNWEWIAYYDSAYSVHRADQPGQVVGLTHPEYNPPRSSIIALLLRDYLDRPVAELMEPFKDDGWELTDVLRAADRRLGKERLLTWGATLDSGHPAKPVLQARFKSLPSTHNLTYRGSG